MGSIYARHRKLWVKYRDHRGEIVRRPTVFYVGQEEDARRALDAAEELVRQQRSDAARGVLGPMTVERYAHEWLKQRAAQGIRSLADERARLELHVLPTLGKLPLAEVEPRHMRELVLELRALKMAPRTVRNVYGVVRVMFHDAVADGRIKATPCVLRKGILPPVEDKDPSWRAGAIYTAEELMMLSLCPDLVELHRVTHALKGFAALRHGEAAGLRWSSWDPSAQPLGRLLVASSYTGRTKSGTVRHVPVHPLLGRVLTRWKEQGWAEYFGREPTAGDLIVPSYRDLTLMQPKKETWRHLAGDLQALGLRHRRGHDLRRTFISLCLAGGARKDLIELVTHAPRRSSALDWYVTIPWEVLCAEVLKMRLGTGLGTGPVTVPNYTGIMVEAPGVEPWTKKPKTRVKSRDCLTPCAY